ncbi:uncharacterized protein SOCE836_017220 [Sorangium cellulosum]|uniref:Uncharacterized protein n=1 Tax=Sorangium cellulosum TaxID=56 RepID=A0A4P2QJ40_SORCE|nr:uncharacterized protein SOCE836_017220 [Sorangium cellulosum]
MRCRTSNDELDDLLNLSRRSDALRPENTTERSRYDPVHRLTCACFSDVESASAPCALRYRRRDSAAGRERPSTPAPRRHAPSRGAPASALGGP